MRIIAALVALEVVLLALILPAFAGPAPMRGEVSVSTTGGYARLVFRFPDEPEADMHLANGILIISFKKPVDVEVDRISSGAPDYINAARLDPDGSAVRIALNRKVTINSMAAGEQLFVDLLPENWTGLPPGLPQQVIDELARRARDAERKARQQEQIAHQRDPGPVLVRVGVQPTFTRYVFELPALIPVETDRERDNLTLRFEAPLKFDLADVLALLPPTVAAVEVQPDEKAASVHYRLIGNPDVRTFREDNNFIVDIEPVDTGDRHRDALAEVSNAGEQPALPRGRVPTPSVGVAASAKPLDPGMAAVAKPPAAGTGVPAKLPAAGASAAARPAIRTAGPPRPPAFVPLPVPRPGGSAQSPPRSAVMEDTVVPASPGSERAPKTATIQSAAAPPAEGPAAPAAGTAEATMEKPAAPAAEAAKTSPEVPPQAAKTSPDAPPQAAAASPAATEQPVAGVRAKAPTDANAPVVVEVRRQGDGLRLVFPFAAQTAAAVFNRADTLWLVFDTAVPIDIATLVAQPIGVVRSAAVSSTPEGQVVRIKLDRPKLTTLEASGSIWAVTIGDMVLGPTSPLSLGRTLLGSSRAGAVIPFEGPKHLAHLSDPEIGDTLLVVTAFGPARGFLKTQDFVEFRVLASTHGVVVQPLADDLNVDALPDKVVISRPSGLVMSAGSGQRSSASEGSQHANSPFDPQIWGYDRESNFTARQDELVRIAADAPEGQRMAARLDLARFYLAQSLFAEARAVLDVAIASPARNADKAAALVMRAVAQIMMGHDSAAYRDLDDPAVHDDYDAPLWRALALAGQGRWADAREGFRTIATAGATIPVELRRIALKEAARTAIELGDLADAADKVHELEGLSVPPELEPAVDLLKGRIAEGSGRTASALATYTDVAQSGDGPIAMQARLRKIELGYALGKLTRSDAIADLELLTVIWRGDDTEVEALQQLGHLYAEEARYRDALQVMRSALKARPLSQLTKRIKDEAAATFEALFLDGKADSMPAIDALSLFYDFREFTPAGRRGDEMIRHLADRLVSVDLLNQAAELLQHQVDHRLQGAARAQVAVRLAMVYLMVRKPDRALQALRDTRGGDLANELRNQRLLLEARALSDAGQHDLALEVIANLDAKNIERLRADILWTARRWREAGEQIEREYGERWRDFAPLTDLERLDILRGAIAYSLAEDPIGLDRFREKYAAKMADGPDRRAFEVVAAPLGAAGTEFADVAKRVVATDTLGAFLAELRARYPDTATSPSTAAPPAAAAPAPQPQSRASAPGSAS